MKISCLQHVPFEGPAYIQQWADDNHHQLVTTPLYLEEILPDILGLDMLIVMGGPMGVKDIHEYSWLQQEKEYILQAINSGIPTLGICLGAQLIADVLGADVYPNSQKEIGWFPVNLNSDAGSSPLFQGFPDQFTPFHWHGDTFKLPREAIRLAENELTPNQGFFLNGHGKKVVALQFHLESTSQSIAELCQHSVGELKQGGEFVQAAQEMSEQQQYLEKSNAIMKLLLNNMVKLWNKME